MFFCLVSVLFFQADYEQRRAERRRARAGFGLPVTEPTRAKRRLYAVAANLAAGVDSGSSDACGASAPAQAAAGAAAGDALAAAGVAAGAAGPTAARPQPNTLDAWCAAAAACGF